MSDLFTANIKILITDDHQVIQQGMAMIIRGFLNKAEIRFANSINTTLSALETERIELLILDINIPGGNNFKMIEQLREVQSDLKILIFSAYEESTYALRYLRAGVNGYLEKSSSEEDILHAVRRILTKGKFFSPLIQDQLFESYDGGLSRNSLYQLTNREIEIARFIAGGVGTGLISEKLDLQASTVSTHKKNIFEKLKISNVSELIDIFRQQGETV